MSTHTDTLEKETMTMVAATPTTTTEQPFQMEWLGRIMQPQAGNPREAWGTLNPGGARGPDGAYYLFPRLVAEGNYSRIGRARVLFDATGRPVGVERLGTVLEPQAPYEVNRLGGGVEDPRVTYVRPLGLFVMTYTAFLPPHHPRIALAVSSDLVTWERLGPLHFAREQGTANLIPHANKDGVFFSELVPDPRGRPALALLHRPTYSVRHSLAGAIVTAAPSGSETEEYIWISYIALDGARADIHHLTQAYGHRRVIINECKIYKLAPQSENTLHAPGAIDLGGTPIPTGKTSGFMAAVDTRSGKIAWKTAVPAPMVGGALATAGGLVFSGSEDGTFYAFDSASGQVRWKANVGLAFGAAPLTYAVNGTQYIAVATGGAAVARILGGKVGGTLAVFKLNGRPISTARFPAAKGASSLTGGVQGHISTRGLTKLNPWMYDNPKTQTVTLILTAAQTTENSGFNFDGYDKGRATFIVPAGWTVNWIFTNTAALPHSAALVKNLQTPAALTSSAGVPIATPNAVQGIIAGTTQDVSFAAVDPGTYYLGCLVPGLPGVPGAGPYRRGHVGSLHRFHHGHGASAAHQIGTRRRRTLYGHRVRRPLSRALLAALPAATRARRCDERRRSEVQSAWMVE